MTNMIDVRNSARHETSDESDILISRSVRKPRKGPNTRDQISGAKKRAQSLKHDQQRDLEISEGDDEVVTRSMRKPKPAPIQLSSSGESEYVTPPSGRATRDRDMSPGPKTPSSGKKTPTKRPTGRNFLLGGSSGAAPLSHSQRRNSGTPVKRFRQPPRLRDKSRGSSTESESDESYHASPKRSLRSSKRSAPKRTEASDVPDRQCSNSETGSQSAARAVKKLPNSPNRPSKAQDKSTARLRQEVSVVISSGSAASSESDIIATPARKRSDKANLKDKQVEPDEGANSELEQEVEDLRDGDAEIQKTRTRGRSNNVERDKRRDKLEELRRRRTGAKELQEESEDHESEEDVLSGSSVHEEASEPKWSNDMDEYDKDFVDDDDDAALGVDLARHGVPLQFTGQANMKPQEYFKYVVEWMICNKIDPAFERHDEIYQLACKKLDDEVQGHAGSTFKSAAWNAEFVKALTKRPNVFRTDVPTMFEHKCDACSRSGHPPKHKLTFQGNQYDKVSLERISENPKHASDSEDSSGDESTVAEPEDNFFVGRYVMSLKLTSIFPLTSFRFCCANAEIAHTLYHWRYHLNETILAWLMTNGHTTPDQIVKREGWSRRKRNKLAIKIVDGMVDSGEMRDLYDQFKQNLEAARSAKVLGV